MKPTAPVESPFDNPRLARHYEDWYEGRGRYADRCEKTLLGELLGGFPATATLLDVGCGTGHFTRDVRWNVASGPTTELLPPKKSL